MKKTILLTVLIVFVLSLQSLYAGDIKRYASARKVLTTPFNYIDKNRDLAGFDIDIARACVKRPVWNTNLSLQDWDGIIPGLIAKSMTVSLLRCPYSRTRQESGFYKKYYQTPVQCVTSQDNILDLFINGIENKTIGGSRGVVGANLAETKFGDSVNIKAYATQDEANMDLASGRVDMVLRRLVILQTGFLDMKREKAFSSSVPLSLTRNILERYRHCRQGRRQSAARLSTTLSTKSGKRQI